LAIGYWPWRSRPSAKELVHTGAAGCRAIVNKKLLHTAHPVGASVKSAFAVKARPAFSVNKLCISIHCRIAKSEYAGVSSLKEPKCTGGE
jgi:hypothetical protein